MDLAGFDRLLDGDDSHVPVGKRAAFKRDVTTFNTQMTKINKDLVRLVGQIRGLCTCGKFPLKRSTGADLPLRTRYENTSKFPCRVHLLRRSKSADMRSTDMTRGRSPCGVPKVLT